MSKATDIIEDIEGYAQQGTAIVELVKGVTGTSAMTEEERLAFDIVDGVVTAGQAISKLPGVNGIPEIAATASLLSMVPALGRDLASIFATLREFTGRVQTGTIQIAPGVDVGLVD